MRGNLKSVGVDLTRVRESKVRGNLKSMGVDLTRVRGIQLK